MDEARSRNVTRSGWGGWVDDRDPFIYGGGCGVSLADSVYRQAIVLEDTSGQMWKCP